MKPNEAPEKIYLEWYRFGDKKHREWVITPKTNNEPVEYTRTDAFIEKAERYIRSVADGLDRDDDVETFISDFKKFMEGE